MLAAIAEHQPALVYLAYPNNPTGEPVRRHGDGTHRGRRAGPGGDGRGLPAVRRARLDRAHDAPPARAGDAHAQQVRPGRRAHRLHGGPQGARRRDRQGAPALQRERAERRGGDLRARTRRRVRAARPPCSAPSARACWPRWPTLPGVQAVPERGQHGAGARARRRRAVRRAQGTQRAGEERLRPAPAAGQLPAPDGGHAGGKHPDDRSPGSEFEIDSRTHFADGHPQHGRRPRSGSASTSTARARPSSPPASASSTTCSTRSPATG